MNTLRHLLIGACCYSLAQGSWAGNDSTMTVKQWEQVARVIATQEETSVSATIGHTKAAARFFSELLYAGALPSTPTQGIRDFTVSPYPPTFVAKYPLKMLAVLEFRDEQLQKQNFMFEKTTTGSLWCVTKSWTASTNGHKVELLPLPSGEAQKQANAAAVVSDED